MTTSTVKNVSIPLMLFEGRDRIEALQAMPP
jgi:hypothetical protein